MSDRIEKLRAELAELKSKNKEDQETRKKRGKRIHELSKEIAEQTAEGYVVVFLEGGGCFMGPVSSEVKTHFDHLSFSMTPKESNLGNVTVIRKPRMLIEVTVNGKIGVTTKLRIGDVMSLTVRDETPANQIYPVRPYTENLYVITIVPTEKEAENVIEDGCTCWE